MASVYRRGTAFYAKVKDSAGRWHNVRTSATKRGQALAAAEELQQQLDQGQPLTSGRAVTLTVAALCVGAGAPPAGARRRPQER